MIELRILRGIQAGGQVTVRHFPVRIGRSPDSDLVLEDAGVWEDHAEIGYDRASGFYMSPLSEGAVIVNGSAVESAALKNGDTLTLGGADVQFWLAPPRQRGFRLLEVVLAAALLGLFAAQVLLIRWLG
jgi:pSer/pThr/pTyr-binding forkhead associated (FHA) protein